MASIQIRSSANAILSQQTIPDTALPKIQAVFGGATASETATRLLDWIIVRAREEVLRRLKEVRAQQDQPIVVAGQVAEATDFETSWPA